jgi:hypothetical protein
VEWDATSVVSMGATGSGKVKDHRPSRRVHGRQGLRLQGVLSACAFGWRACEHGLRAMIFYGRSHSMSEPFTELRFTGGFGVRHGITIFFVEGSFGRRHQQPNRANGFPPNSETSVVGPMG